MMNNSGNTFLFCASTGQNNEAVQPTCTKRRHLGTTLFTTVRDGSSLKTENRNQHGHALGKKNASRTCFMKKFVNPRTAEIFGFSVASSQQRSF